MTHQTITAGRPLRGHLRRAAVLAVAPLVLTGCDGLFDVDNPVDILEGELENERILPALVNSAEGAVARAYDLAVQYGELPGDGIIHVSTNQGNLALDRGILDEFNERAEALYNEMAAARWAATEVTRRLEVLVADPSTDAAVARAYFWDAVARITLADVTEEVPFDGAAPQTPAEVYAGAIALLEKSATVSMAANQANYAAAAYATAARAYRSLYYEAGDAAALELAREMAEKALATKADFRVDIAYQTPGSSNGVYAALLGGTQYDVMDPVYANLHDPASGQRDDRVQHSPLVTVMLSGDSVYTQMKYLTRDSDIRVSGWQEAALILAEYHLLKGDLDRAVGYVNQVRIAAGLPAFAGGAAEAVREQLRYERRAEFWLEARRWQDMRYYGEIPARWNPAMQQAGVDRRFPVSLRERSANPHYSG